MREGVCTDNLELLGKKSSTLTYSANPNIHSYSSHHPAEIQSAGQRILFCFAFFSKSGGKCNRNGAWGIVFETDESKR